MPVDLKVAAARRQKLELAFRKIEKQLQSGTWLARRNRYLRDTVRLTDKSTGHRYGQLVSYIAASAPLHAIDSSRYLGRALYCQSVNDVHSARHFAYYAELRAAMSILASEGLGVFNNFHYAVVKTTMAHRSGKLATHAYVWEALSEWSKSSRAAELISRVITRNGKTLEELLVTAFPSLALQPIASSWFRVWGIDLSILAAEKQRRNDSSYRPSGLLARSTQSPRLAVNSLAEFWTAFEPTGRGRFEYLDRDLLRLAFEQQANAVGVRRSSLRFRDLARKVAAEAAESRAEIDLLTTFLLRTHATFGRDLSVIVAAQRKPRAMEVDQFAMICRAGILLRMALGSVNLLVVDSGFQQTVFRNWLQRVAIESAVITAMSGSEDRFGLWDAIADELNVLAADTSGLSSFAEVVAILPREIMVLSECERIAILALAS
jgi:hypothetical protein